MSENIYSSDFPYFLFSEEEFNNAKSRQLLNLKCSYCGKTFTKEKHYIQGFIKKKRHRCFCSRECEYNGFKKSQFYTEPHICKFCGESFIKRPSKYANGNFGSNLCARRYSSIFANTKEKRKEKSNTEKENYINNIENLTEEKLLEIKKRHYYLDCKFRFDESELKKVKGYELIEKYGLFVAWNNVDGVSKDHMISKDYGWKHGIDPKIISHPANCEIITQRENSGKSNRCSITLEELKERIKNWK